MFGKIKDGELIIAPKRITHNGYVHYNPTDKTYAEAGYLLVVETPYPTDTDDVYYIARYEEQDGKIVRVWEQAEPPAPVIPPYSERVVARIREVYSVDDELAILRQKDTKPEEFEQYFAFVEKIKAEEKGDKNE